LKSCSPVLPKRTRTARSCAWGSALNCSAMRIVMSGSWQMMKTLTTMTSIRVMFLRLSWLFDDITCRQFKYFLQFIESLSSMILSFVQWYCYTPRVTPPPPPPVPSVERQHPPTSCIILCFSMFCNVYLRFPHVYTPHPNFYLYPPQFQIPRNNPVFV